MVLHMHITWQHRKQLVSRATSFACITNVVCKALQTSAVDVYDIVKITITFMLLTMWSELNEQIQAQQNKAVQSTCYPRYLKIRNANGYPCARESVCECVQTQLY